MGVKSSAQLLAAIAALTPLIDDTEVKGILTDMVDSMGTSIRPYPDPLDGSITLNGDTNRNHALGITVLQVFVTDSRGALHIPNITRTDTNNTIIHWAGPSESNCYIVYLGY